MLMLYYSPGACSLAVHIALLENELPFELTKVDLHTHMTEAGIDFSTINPKNYVPVLELEGSRLTEAAAILYYIAQSTGNVPQPEFKDPFAAYRLQEALTFVSSELHKSVGTFFNKAVPEEYKVIVREKIQKRLDYLESVFSKQEYLLGDKFSVADAYCFTILRWAHLVEIGLQLKDWQKVYAYYTKIGARPNVKEALSREGLKR